MKLRKMSKLERKESINVQKWHEDEYYIYTVIIL